MGRRRWPVPSDRQEAAARILVDGRYVHDAFPGIGRYTCELLRGLGAVASGHEVLVLRDPALPNRRHDLDSLAGIRLVDCMAPRFLPFEQWRLPALVGALRPDVFHAPFYLRPWRLPCPVVVSIFDIIPVTYPEGAPRRARALLHAWAIRAAAARSRIVLVPSDSAARELARLLGSDRRLRVVPLGAGAAFRPRGAEEVRRVREHHRLPPSYVLHVGSNRCHKNRRGLLEAWSRLRRSQATMGAHLVLGGATGDGGRAADASVRILGEIPEADLPALYSGAALFVLPSLAEGFGLPVLEAMACGAPVACSDGGSLAEITAGSALLFDPHDPGAIASAMEKALRDERLRQSLTERGLARSRAYSWRATADGTLRAYVEAAGTA